MTGIEPLIVAWALAWVFIKSADAVRREWRHTVERNATEIGRLHGDWSPGRVHRNARRRARAYWWQEAGAGFPAFRAAWREHLALVRAERAEAMREGEKRIADLRERLERALAAASPDSGPAAPSLTGPEAPPAPADPQPAPDSAPRPGLTVLPGGKDAAEPEPETPPASPEPGLAPWTVQEDELREAGRCVRYLGSGPDGPEHCGKPAEPGSGYCPACKPGTPASPSTSAAADSGSPATEGDEDVSLIEEAETPYEGMLATLAQFAGAARNVANQAADDLQAAAVVHGFSRDAATMADLESLADSASALAARAEQARTGMMDRHEAGAEYHEGQDAHASAFRPN